MPELPRPSDRPPSLWSCAAADCTVNPADDPGAGHLERISPKGGPFAGFCPTHDEISSCGRLVKLKPEAVAILEWSEHDA